MVLQHKAKLELAGRKETEAAAKMKEADNFAAQLAEIDEELNAGKRIRQLCKTNSAAWTSRKNRFPKVCCYVGCALCTMYVFLVYCQHSDRTPLASMYMVIGSAVHSQHEYRAADPFVLLDQHVHLGL